MTWVRIGDTAPTFPPLLSVAALPDAPDGATAMMFGFMVDLAARSSAYLTDYVVTAGHVMAAGSVLHRWLLDAATTTGLLIPLDELVNGVPAYKIVDDADFIHLRLRNEVEWERQQRRETLDPRLTVPVRLRDGDNCRYCGVLVHWMGRKSSRKATLDHLRPRDEHGNVVAARPETVVVACLGCNSELRDAAGEDRLTPNPPPGRPVYGQSTARWLRAQGVDILTGPSADDGAAEVSGPRAVVVPTGEQPGADRPITADTMKSPNETLQVEGTDPTGSGSGQKMMSTKNRVRTKPHGRKRRNRVKRC